MRVGHAQLAFVAVDRCRAQAFDLVDAECAVIEPRCQVVALGSEAADFLRQAGDALGVSLGRRCADARHDHRAAGVNRLLAADAIAVHRLVLPAHPVPR
ncbi:MAG: hypothetical protein ACK5QX_10990 [bacterium]